MERDWIGKGLIAAGAVALLLGAVWFVASVVADAGASDAWRALLGLLSRPLAEVPFWALVVALMLFK